MKKAFSILKEDLKADYTDPENCPGATAFKRQFSQFKESSFYNKSIYEKADNDNVIARLDHGFTFIEYCALSAGEEFHTEITCLWGDEGEDDDYPAVDWEHIDDDMPKEPPLPSIADIA